MMLYTKYESSGPCTFRQKDFWKLHFENLIFDPMTYLCNQSEPFEQIWKGPVTNPVAFGQILISSSKYVDWTFLDTCIIQSKIVTKGHNLNNFGRVPLVNAVYKAHVS